MSGLNDILEIGRRSLMAQRLGIDIAGHNISNASTPGYSRQRLELGATPPIKESYGLLGTGVMAQSIQRIRVEFLDQQIRSTNYNLGEASQQERVLGQIEAILNEPTDSGLGSMVTKFFGAFQDLSLHPEETTSRNTIVLAAKMMNDSFHQLTSSLQQLKGDLTLDAQAQVAEVNRLVKDIYDNDQNILKMEMSGAVANDARDYRDQKLEELSKLVDVRVSQDTQGGTLLVIGGALVESRTGYMQLASRVANGQLEIVTQGAEAPVDVSSGDLGGILKTYNSTVPAYQGKFDTLALAIITEVNAIHTTGCGLGNPPPSGNNFFTGTDARTIDLSDAIKADINNVASSTDGAPGNNDLALDIARIPTKLLMNGNAATIPQFYNELVSEIGASVQTVTNSAKSNQLVLKQLENQRSSISGVSIDEEMVDLIKFQRGFDAAAKVINTVNEMYGTLLNMV
jgi:flagellar hook-associated protein 1 FlgK